VILLYGNRARFEKTLNIRNITSKNVDEPKGDPHPCNSLDCHVKIAGNNVAVTAKGRASEDSTPVEKDNLNDFPVKALTTFSQERGDIGISSTCIFCGAEASVNVVFPKTFTAYQFLQAGSKACLRCAEMFVDPKCRRNSWILRNGNLETVNDPLIFLVNLPDPPFCLYLTKKKRKHGWILAVQNPVLNRDRFILIVDEEKILFEREKFVEFEAFAHSLRKKGVPKKVLLGGMPLPSVKRKYDLSWEECSKLRGLQRNSLWRVVVEFEK